MQKRRVFYPRMGVVLSLLFISASSEASEGTPIQSSPSGVISYSYPPNKKLSDYAVSADGKKILSLVSESGDASTKLIFLAMDAKSISATTEKSFEGTAVAVVAHPEKVDTWFILLQSKSKETPWQIKRIEIANGNALQEKVIYTSKNLLRRLIISSRPFAKNDAQVGFRLFFSEKNGSNLWVMKSVSESGDRVVTISNLKQPKAPYECPAGISSDDATNGYGCTEIPSTIYEPKGALPLSFHPGGNHFLYEDLKGCVKVSDFATQWSAKENKDCSKMAFYHPNGEMRWSWSKGKKGIQAQDLLSGSSVKSRILFSEYEFTMPPIFLPDGRSVAGLTNANGHLTLSIIPTNEIRLGIVNLWRFAEDLKETDLQLIEKSGGIFKSDGKRFFHEVYDSFQYSSPKKPDIILTDPFWYTTSLAMEAGFVLMEKRGAIPAFTKFLEGAIQELSGKKNVSVDEKSWLKIFLVTKSLLSDQAPVDQKAKGDFDACSKSEKIAHSDLLRKQFDFTLCKPRSHYEDDITLARYWRSFRYFALGTGYNPLDGEFSKSVLAVFPSLSAETLANAINWHQNYSDWMAPSTFPGIREKNPQKRWEPAHPFRHCGLNTVVATSLKSLFPLGWGWDDETMCLIIDKKEKNPSLEDWLVSFSGVSEYQKWAEKSGTPLPWAEWGKASIEYFKNSQTDSSLYAQYLKGIKNDLTSAEPRGVFSVITKDFLRVRSTLSAVGAWTHLKHTLQLVSEEPSGAEAGQGGPDIFETLVEDIPPNAVEPRPEVFSAQKSVIDSAIRLTEPYISAGENEVKQRMTEISTKLSLFAKAAELQENGKSLDPQMNEEARKIGGFLDHADLFFHSMMNKDYSIARSMDPDMSMAILASISNYAKKEKKTGYVATGKPLTTYFLVEQDGKRRLVVGGSFSVYSFEDKNMISDKEWRKNYLKKASLPIWLKPHVSQ